MSAPAERPRAFFPPNAIGLAALVLGLLGFAAYHNALVTPFVFDDLPSIVGNTSIRHLWPLGDVLLPRQAGGVTTSGRPFLNLSLALNYAVSGERVWSYHALNLLIHLAAGLTLFGLARRTLLLTSLRARFGAAALPLAWVMAAVWMLHPLQTESVTYLVQRAESLAGLCCLFTLYAFVRGATEAGARGWLGVSVTACALAMASKESAAALPVLVLLYDRTFLAGTFRAAWAARRRVHLGMASTWLLLACLVIGTGGRGGTAAVGVGLSVWRYALTQCGAIVHYLALSAWPHPLVFDYGLATAPSLAAVWPQAVVLGGLLIATGVALVRRPALGFLGAWFFALLAPSSSFVPIVTQTMAEHRMYLPLAAVVALGVLAAYAWVQTRALVMWSLVVPGLAVATFSRNADYRSDAVLWADTAAKLPGNARAHNNLGQALYREGRQDEAIACYNRVLALQPNYPETHYNLGVALAQRGQNEAALAHYETALRVDPNYPEAHNNLGNLLVRLGRAPEALPHFETALRLKPDFAEALNNLGNALLASNRAAESVAYFRRALAARPEYPEANYNLGNALAAGGDMTGALDAYRRALALKPDYAEAHVNAGNASLQLDRAADAIRHFQQAITLNPKLAEARFNLGSALLDLERWAEAIPQFEAVLQLDPGASQARRALGYALAKSGRTAEAIAQLETYLRAVPGDADTRAFLADLKTPGRGRGPK